MTDDGLYLVDVLLLCTECHEPIKARINTEQWIRVEFIGPGGECRSCLKLKKEGSTETKEQVVAA